MLMASCSCPTQMPPGPPAARMLAQGSWEGVADLPLEKEINGERGVCRQKLWRLDPNRTWFSKGASAWLFCSSL